MYVGLNVKERNFKEIKISEGYTGPGEEGKTLWCFPTLSMY